MQVGYLLSRRGTVHRVHIDSGTVLSAEACNLDDAKCERLTGPQAIERGQRRCLRCFRDEAT